MKDELGNALGQLWKEFLADTSHWLKHDFESFMEWLSMRGEE